MLNPFLLDLAGQSWIFPGDCSRMENAASLTSSTSKSYPDSLVEKCLRSCKADQLYCWKNVGSHDSKRTNIQLNKLIYFRYHLVVQCRKVGYHSLL